MVKATKKAAAKPATAKPDASVAPRAARREALATAQAAAERPEDKAPPKLGTEGADLEHSVGRQPGGMEPPHTLESQKAALDAMFASADAKNDPRFDELQAGLAVRGY